MALQVSSHALNVGTLVGGDTGLVHGEVNKNVHELGAVVNHLGDGILGSVQVVAAVGKSLVGGSEVALELSDAAVAGVLCVSQLVAQVVDLTIEQVEFNIVHASGSGIVSTEDEVNTQ